MKQKLLMFTCIMLWFNCPAKESVSDFGFPEGSWTMNLGKGRIVESWKMNKDSGMNGISFSINNTGDSTLMKRSGYMNLPAIFITNQEKMGRVMIPQYRLS